MKEDEITFVNVVVDLIKCYCHDNNSDSDKIFDAISTAFRDKEKNNGNGHQTGNIEEK